MIDMPLNQFISDLAARQPTPAGGAAAAYTAAMGAALLQMVFAFCHGKKANHDRQDEIAACGAALGEFKDRFLPMLERDCKSFEFVSQAYLLPKGGDAAEVRQKALEEALRGAMTVPEEILCLCRDALARGVEFLDCLGKNVASDFAVGAALLHAAAEAASMSIISNASFLMDRKVADSTHHRVSDLLEQVVVSKTRIDAAVGVLLV